VFFSSNIDKRCELRIAQVPALIGVHDAARQRLVIAALGPDPAALLGHDDRGAGVLAHRQYAAGCNVGVLQEVDGDKRSFSVASGSSRIAASCLRWPGRSRWLMSPKAVSDKKPQALRIDREDFLAAKCLDADVLVGQLAPWCGVGSKREEIVCHGMPFGSPEIVTILSRVLG
jgi:hypothetical protein